MKTLIYLEDAIDALMKRDKALRNINWYDKPYAEDECKGIDEALDIISALPSAEPERKTGRWIFHETQNDRYDDIICPFCKKTYTVDAHKMDDIGFTAEDFNYCPNCGSYNGGKDEEADIS